MSASINKIKDLNKKVGISLNPDTKIDLTTDVLNDGTVYSVVRFVVVRSAFLFIKLFAINLQRSFQLPFHLLILVDTLCLVFV